MKLTDSGFANALDRVGAASAKVKKIESHSGYEIVKKAGPSLST